MGEWRTKGRKAERLIPIPPLFNISCVFSVSFDSFWLGFLFFSFSLFLGWLSGAKGRPGLLGLSLGTYTWIGGLHNTTAFFFCFCFFSRSSLSRCCWEAFVVAVRYTTHIPSSFIEILLSVCLSSLRFDMQLSAFCSHTLLIMAFALALG